MKLDYTFEREDYIKFLKMSNNKSNFACLLFFTFVYFIAVLDVMKENLLLVFLFYFISIALLYSILKIISTVFANLVVKRNDKVLEYAYGTYHISIDKQVIREEIKEKKIEVKFSSIAHIKVSKNYFVVVHKEGGIFYIFMKSGFKTEEKYRECKELILRNFAEVKQRGTEVELVTKTEKNREETKEIAKTKKTNEKENVPKNKENKQQENGGIAKETASENKVKTKKKVTEKEAKKK